LIADAAKIAADIAEQIYAQLTCGGSALDAELYRVVSSANCAIIPAPLNTSAQATPSPVVASSHDVAHP
jgi:hypothetical protein